MDHSAALNPAVDSTATLRRPAPSPARSAASSSASSSSSAAAAVEEATAVAAAGLFPGQNRSLAGVALRAYCLGIGLAAGTLLAMALAALPLVFPSGSWAAAAAAVAPLWRLPVFLAALAVFHFLEFWTTAQYNTPAARTSSFLLTANWPGYAIAHAAACAECLLRWTIFARWRLPVVWTLLPGFACLVVGQAVRTAAMAHAGRSFNHTIQQRRASSHVLVTSGIYGHLRHPSYFGFFWWALGTQLVLGNTVCLAGYAVVLWRFFSMRIRHEETLLVRFFGDDYVAYKKRVGTKIPFI